MLFVRQIDEQTPRDRDQCRQARPFAIDRVLDDLDKNTLSFVQHPFDRACCFAALARLTNVGDVQKGGSFKADVDEGRLHPRQDAHYPSQIDVANEATAGGALNVQFLDRAQIHHRNTGFLRGKVDEDVFAHGGLGKEVRMMACILPCTVLRHVP